MFSSLPIPRLSVESARTISRYELRIGSVGRWKSQKIELYEQLDHMSQGKTRLLLEGRSLQRVSREIADHFALGNLHPESFQVRLHVLHSRTTLRSNFIAPQKRNGSTETDIFPSAACSTLKSTCFSAVVSATVTSKIPLQVTICAALFFEFMRIVSSNL
jgi:hypothetical protein